CCRAGRTFSGDVGPRVPGSWRNQEAAAPQYPFKLLDTGVVFALLATLERELGPRPLSGMVIGRMLFVAEPQAVEPRATRHERGRAHRRCMTDASGGQQRKHH